MFFTEHTRPYTVGQFPYCDGFKSSSVQVCSIYQKQRFQLHVLVWWGFEQSVLFPDMKKRRQKSKHKPVADRITNHSENRATIKTETPSAVPSEAADSTETNNSVYFTPEDRLSFDVLLAEKIRELQKTVDASGDAPAKGKKKCILKLMVSNSLFF